MGKGPNYKANPLPAVLRFYFYGIQGFCDEIVFTSIFDFFKGGDWSLKGHSSISSFFIYGLCCFLVERLYVWMYLKHGVQWYFRVPLYMCICYSWEFSCGFILRLFNACPWDYSHYDYNFMGLITLEYAPGWLVLSFLQDVLADFLLRVQILPTIQDTDISMEAGDRQANKEGHHNNFIRTDVPLKTTQHINPKKSSMSQRHKNK